MDGANSLANLMYLQILKEVIHFSSPSVKLEIMEENLFQSSRASAVNKVRAMVSTGLPFIQTLILWLTQSLQEQFRSKCLHTTPMEITETLETVQPPTMISLNKETTVCSPSSAAVKQALLFLKTLKSKRNNLSLITSSVDVKWVFISSLILL
jgi:hypothetical protein